MRASSLCFMRRQTELCKCAAARCARRLVTEHVRVLEQKLRGFQLADELSSHCAMGSMTSLIMTR